MSVFRIYVEKKPEFAVEAQSVLSDVRTALRLGLTGLRILNRYDADKLSQEDFEAAVNTVFSEPAVDVVYRDMPRIGENDRVFAVEHLPGQFDQRADSCEQCIQILRQGERCRVRNARVYIVSGTLTDEEFNRLKAYIINPVESREATLDTFKTLDSNYDIPTTVEELEGFTKLNAKGLHAFIDKFGLAMDYDDIKFCQDYFRNEEHRDPTITEICMIDTSGLTTAVTLPSSQTLKGGHKDSYIKDTYDMYLNVREELGRSDRPVTLMDIGTLAAKKLKADVPP